MVDVTIIFVNYKTKDLTSNAIKSVMEKTVGLDYEIFVVDNNSQDGSIEAIEKEFPNINIIKNSVNAGFGSANNLAIKQAKGKYILCLNTDTILINNAIKIMFDFMEKPENKKFAACGGYLVDGNGKPCACGGNFPNLTEIIWKIGLRKIFKEYYKNFSLTLNSNDSKFIKNIDYITGADIFFRKSVLDKVGLFDEQIFMYFEETDLCKRIANAGYNVSIISDARIIHLEQQSSSDNIERIKRSKRSEFYYFNKYHKKQVLLIKFLYLCLYFIDGYILNKSTSRILVKFLLKEL